MATKIHLLLILLVAIAPDVSLADIPVSKPLSRCLTWFQTIRYRPQALFHTYENARDMRLAEIFPNVTNPSHSVNTSGRQLNHTPEQVRRFRELVDIYFDFRIRRQGYEDMARFRQWLEKNHNTPYPPIDSLDLRAWVENNETIDSLLMRYYQTYQQERFDIANNATFLADNFGARSIGRRIGNKSVEYAQQAGVSLLTFTRQFAVGIATAVVGTAGFTGNLAFVTELPAEAQRRVRGFFIDQSALNAVHRSTYRVIQEYQAEAFTNDDEGFQRWTNIENRLSGYFADISREAALIHQSPTLPTNAAETRRQMQSRYEETHSDLLEMEQVKQRLLLEMQRTPNSDEASNVSLVSLRTQIEHLDAVIAITRQSIARQLASWRLSNLFQRSYHRGRSNTPDQALEAENVILNQQIARIRQMGLLAEFQNSFGLQLFEWKKQSQRLGLGRDQ